MTLRMNIFGNITFSSGTQLLYGTVPPSTFSRKRKWKSTSRVKRECGQNAQ